MTDRGSGPVARTVLQQCLQARLQVKPADGDSEAQFVQCPVCSTCGCASPTREDGVVAGAPRQLLIVPQATLGGKNKGRAMQYHNNISKEDGLRLYSAFVALCEKELSGVEGDVTVKHGTYGNRQVLKLDTNGPYTHLMEF
ncbi:hypothetical protein INR49_007880 [Caranx melampygus]|nr:hypothetical protein INR49_007880 [Caranx melampygus]